jgi:NitT/TauT family transport system ATP-binding protein
MDAMHASAQPLLRLESVGKSYRLASGEPHVALLPVSADIGRGEFVSFVGPSGCGKTTLLKLCASLITLTEGRVRLADGDRPLSPRQFGFVFQSPALLPWRTVLANVTLPMTILGLDRDPAVQRAQELLALVGLADSAGKYPGELSGGMQQRVAIARALLHDPAVLFMDEPFGALDAMTRESLNMELQRIQQHQRKTVLFVTHDIEEATLLSDRVFVMSAGPGRVVDELEIALPRPRRIDTKATAEFQDLARRVRSALEIGRPQAVAG